MHWPTLMIAGIAFLAAAAATRFFIPVLKAMAVLDHPNDRSSHETATPRGAGLAIVAVVASAWLALAIDGETDELWRIAGLIAAAIVLTVISWVDDRRGLPAIRRLVVQAVAVTAGLLALSEPGRTFQGLLPLPLDLALTALLWLWFVNLTNFMDGIDGITGVELGAIAAGMIVLAVLGSAGTLDVLGIYSAGLFGAVAGFLVWNWSPAKVFLGDSGSVPLGFLTGWLLLELAAAGAWAAALILPAYYLGDATITLLRRILRRERLTQAHRSHFYQQAAQRWQSHARVSLVILALNAILIALAAWSSIQPWWALVLATASTLAVFAVFRDRAGDKP
ncbi:MAG: hypothetical protein FJX65_08805 [Alphaproteobacteria bacterium]|nr:hypothetical protein [Alphaproteobacteria bacterium]